MRSLLGGCEGFRKPRDSGWEPFQAAPFQGKIRVWAAPWVLVPQSPRYSQYAT